MTRPGATLSAVMERPPRSTARRLVGIAAIGALLVPLFVPISPDLRQHPLFGALGDRVHIVMFAVLTLILYHRGPVRGRILASIGVSIAVGAVTEIAQSLTGRSPSFGDLYQDALGTALAGCWLAWRHRDRRLLPATGAAAVVLAVWWPLRDLPTVVTEVRAAEPLFPVLADFERPQAFRLWSPHLVGEYGRVELPDGGHVLEIRHSGDDRWPGAASPHLAWNWTGWDTLLVDARLVEPSPDSLRVSLWVNDRANARDVDAALSTHTVGHRWQTLSMPLHEVRTLNDERPLTLRVVVSVAVFMHRPVAGGADELALQIDNVRLTRRGD